MGGASGLPPRSSRHGGVRQAHVHSPAESLRRVGLVKRKARATTADVQGQVRGPPLSVGSHAPTRGRVSAQDAALSITFWALLHGVPTSLAITIAAAPAKTPITASAMPYSARSWPASSTIKFFISAVMLPPFRGRPRVRCHGSRGVPARSDPDASHPAPSPSSQDYAADKAAVKKIVSRSSPRRTGAAVTPGARRGRRAVDLRGPQQKPV